MSQNDKIPYFTLENLLIPPNLTKNKGELLIHNPD